MAMPSTMVIWGLSGTNDRGCVGVDKPNYTFILRSADRHYAISSNKERLPSQWDTLLFILTNHLAYNHSLFVSKIVKKIVKLMKYLNNFRC